MRRVLLLLLLVFAFAFTGSAQDINDDPSETMRQLVQRLVTDGPSDFGFAVDQVNIIAESDNPLFIAPLLDLAYFTRSASFAPLNDAIYTALENLTGQALGQDWQAYFEWASANDVALPDGYDSYKGALFSALIDPQFERFWSDVQGTAKVNLLEAVWGGVRVDGIPSLVNATQITPEQAAAEGELFQEFCRGDDCSYPAVDEYVFGVSINGNNRAYPLRLLNWHEMFNDVIGSAPLYDAPDGEVICNFLAPAEFSALGRMGEDWVFIAGESAGCPFEGWLTDPATLNWDWQTVRDELPDLAASEPLNPGISGQVAGVPVMLAYCTLCGSGILYNPIIEVDGQQMTLEFGSTGMLMRSNKLMYDRSTDTVWNALTGEPAFGPLADEDIQLERLPVVVTDWATWLETHPDTTVLSLNTGFRRNYTNGGAYADYFNDPNFVMFPVWQQDTSEQQNKEVVFALLLEDTPKAYPLRTIIPEQVVNDSLAGVDLVIISRETPNREFFEPGGAEVRAYERGEFMFTPGENHREVVDQDGAVWCVTEAALIGPDEMTLARLPGHLAFWFGWYGFYPQTLVYEG